MSVCQSGTREYPRGLGSLEFRNPGNVNLILVAPLNGHLVLMHQRPRPNLYFRRTIPHIAGSTLQPERASNHEADLLAPLHGIFRVGICCRTAGIAIINSEVSQHDQILAEYVPGRLDRQNE